MNNQVESSAATTAQSESTGYSNAEQKLQEQTDNAKNKLLEEIKQFQVEDPYNGEEEEEQEDPRVKMFAVFNPMKVGGHIKYTVSGVDETGEFQEIRRYREFHALSTVLRTRWPGCYVPSLPEKKMINQKDA